MKILELCQGSIVSIDAAASLQEAASLMRTEHVGALIVTTGENGQPHAAGVITDRDLAIEALACPMDPVRGFLDGS